MLAGDVGLVRSYLQLWLHIKYDCRVDMKEKRSIQDEEWYGQSDAEVNSGCGKSSVTPG